MNKIITAYPGFSILEPVTEAGAIVNVVRVPVVGWSIEYNETIPVTFPNGVCRHWNAVECSAGTVFDQHLTEYDNAAAWIASQGR